MLKLHGTVISHFYCAVKQVLLEKGIAFEEVLVRPNQEPAFLALSPMGKIPLLETEHGYLSETNVILEYIEAVQPSPALYPQAAFARAKVKELIKVVELYIEAPAHQMIPALFGAPLPDHLRDTTRPLMERGLAALGRLAQFAPWVCGEQYTAADIFLYRLFALISVTAEKLCAWDVLVEVAGLQEWHARMAQRPLTRAIDEETTAARQAFARRTGGA